MVYQIILKNKQIVNAWGENMYTILEMMIEHDIIAVCENEFPNMTTYILREDISHYRFPSEYKGVVKPVS